MKRIFSTILFAAALAGLVACADIDGLRSDVDDLKSRVTALEKQVDIFNGNIETLQLLASSSTINTVTETADGYELLMSNGRIITLKNGADGEGVTPILSIDAEGYWMVDYRDGEGFRPIFRDGEKVKAVGLDGVTPSTASTPRGIGRSIAAAAGERARCAEQQGEGDGGVQRGQSVFLLCLL